MTEIFYSQTKNPKKLRLKEIRPGGALAVYDEIESRYPSRVTCSPSSVDQHPRPCISPESLQAALSDKPIERRKQTRMLAKPANTSLQNVGNTVFIGIRRK